MWYWVVSDHWRLFSEYPALELLGVYSGQQPNHIREL